MSVSIIAAVAANGVIGRNNKMIWRYPKDMQRFVEITKNAGIVIMGRKTHESIGKALPGRINIIISRDKSYRPVLGCLLFRSVEEALNLLNYYNKEIVVIGGEQTYKAFLPHANKLYITNINAPYQGDTYFPDVNTLEWVHVSEERHSQDKSHQFSFSFDTYVRAKQ